MQSALISPFLHPCSRCPMSFLSAHGLSFQLPDGRLLFENIDLAFGAEITGLVGRNGVGKSSLISLLAGMVQPSAGTVRRTGKIALLRQMAHVRDDETVAGLFDVEAQLARLARIEAGVADDDDLAEADWTLQARFEKALADVGLEGVAFDRLLVTLSGGQRTRAALAALAFHEPDLILLDEPSNNLDRDGRQALYDFLDRWRGGAVIVSHDRELLARMDRIIELSSRGTRIYGGNFDAYQAQRDAERAGAEKALESAERMMRQKERAAQEARERQARRASAGRKSRVGSSDPKILLDARKERAEATTGRVDRLAERLEADAREALERSRDAVERRTPFSAGMSGAQVPAGKVLVEARALAIGRANGEVLNLVDLTIVGPERVAVSGRNGVGKSTLLKTLAGLLPPLGGMLQVHARVAYFDQQVSLLQEDASILDNYRRINDGASDNECRSALARYAFRADAALQVVATLSGGERLRAGLACVAAGKSPPEMLMLDEPTNHLDLESVAEVEAGLREFGGALLVVSHDETFLENIGIERRLAL